MSFKNIEQFKFWCYKILPLVYDDSLSYYEILCKVVNSLNEVIENINSLPDYIAELVSDESLKEILKTLLNSLEEQIANANEETSTAATSDRTVGELVWINGNLYRCTKSIDTGNLYVINSNIEKVTIEEVIKRVASNISGTFETDNRLASANRSVGDIVWFNNDLYEILQYIPQGNAYIVGTNCVKVNIVDLLKYLKTYIADEVSNRKEADTTLDNKITRVSTELNSHTQIFKKIISDLRVANVLDYGAKGDGITDDTNSFNLAIADINANNKDILFMPYGTYVISKPLDTITKSGTRIIGAGQGITKISVSETLLTSTNSLFSIENTSIYNIEIKDFSIIGVANVSTNFYCFFVDNTHNLYIHDIYIENVGSFIKTGSVSSNGGIWTIIENIIGSVVHNYWIDIGGYNGIHHLNCQVNSEIEYSGSTVTSIRTTIDTAYFDNCLFQRFNYGIILEALSGTIIQNIYISNTDFDGIQYQSLSASTAGGIIIRIYYRGSWFTSIANDAVVLTATDGSINTICFNDCDFVETFQRSIVAQGNIYDLQIDNCDITSYNKDTSGLYPAIDIITENVSQFRITNNNIGNTGGVSYSKTAIRIANGATNYIVADNNVYDNIGDKIILGTPSTPNTCTVHDNAGFNPVGLDTSFVTPNSGEKYTHNLPMSAMYYIRTGVVENININDYSLGAKVSSFRLNQGDTFSYTGETVTIARYII